MNDFNKMKELLQLVGTLEKQALYESSLVEGIKFGKKEMNDIISRSTDFNVGIEYEFRPTYEQKDNLNDWLRQYGISRHIHKIIPEHDLMTEVITTKMSVSQAISLLDNMTQLIIDKEIEVPNMAGQHISISTNKYSQGTINMVKFLTLMNSQYLHKLFPEREFVDNLYHKTLKQLDISKYNIKTKSGLDKFENDFNDIVGEKYQTIKVSDYTSVDMTGRIELRFFGGEDYHKQLELTKREMLRGLFLLEIAHTDLYQNEYLKELYKNFYSDNSKDLKQVMINPDSIKDIDNPSEELQLIAVKLNGNTIQYINNPSEEIQLIAVRQDGWAIQYINNPSEELQLIAVKQNGWVIQYINNPSEELQLEAAKQNGLVIQYIDNPSEEVQIAAVKQNGNAIQYIDNPSEEVQLVAVRQDEYVIRYIIDKGIIPSEEVQLVAVRQDEYVIRYIDNPSEEVQLAAVTYDGTLIQYIDNPSTKVQLAAVKENGNSIKFIIEKGITPSEKVQALHNKLWG